MAVEARRGCGYRKIGGTYLEGDPGGWECGRLPLAIVACPLCDHRPAFSRNLQRITPKNILHAAKPCRLPPEHCLRCPLASALEIQTAGLSWVGGRFYTPASFTEEAERLGISRRVPFVPKWVKVGETWIYLAHERVFSEPCPKLDQPPLDGVAAPQETGKQHGEKCELCNEGMLYKPGVFHAFVPRRIVRVIPETMPVEERRQLETQGLTLVEVPHDDPDHQPRKSAEEEEE